MAASDQEVTENLDKKAHSIFPGYALYKLQSEKSEGKSLPLNPESGDQESSNKKDDNINLSVVLTSLNSENEGELKKFLTKRLSKGSSYAGQGHISGLEFSVESEDPDAGSSLCYYCVLREDTSLQDPGASDVVPGSRFLAGSQDFVLCLLAEQESVLDIFRPELNKFSNKILQLLQSDPILKYDLEDSGELSDLEKSVKPVLASWYDHMTTYLTSTVARLQEAVKYVIYAALLDTKLDIVCSDSQLRSDILRFQDVCSLSEVLENKSSSSGTDSDSAQLVDIGLPIVTNTKSVKITVDAESCKVDHTACSMFCDDWSSSLVSADDNSPVLLRQIIDTYKLRVIQDLNTLTRLLREAEADFYALYRCHIFLKSCGNSRILMHHIGKESVSRDVIQVLQELLEPATAS